MQLIAGALAAAAVIALASPASAQTAFETKVQLYVDDDHTEVVSPVVSARADVDDDTAVTAGYVADVITSASIDVVTQASPTTIHDTRHQVSMGASRKLGPWSAHLGYTFSTENDYRSHGLGAGVARTMLADDTTLSLDYALALNTVGRADDDNFARDLDVHDTTATWTQLWTPRLATQLTYELGYASGFQASPYRFVPVRDDVMDVARFWVPETDPETRWRHAAVVAANLHLGDHGAVQADYRVYRDTWDIVSHTIGARWYVDLTDRVELRLRSRFYTQTEASFYQASYPALGRYMTIDRELSPMWSETVGGKLMIAVTDRLEAEAKLDAFYYRYADFPLLPWRVGANVGLGLTLTY